MRKYLVLGLVLGLVAAPAMATDQYSNFKDWALANGHGGAGGEAQGDVIETFPVSWAGSPLGLAIDHGDTSRMVFFHESDPDPGIWFVDVAAGHAATSLTYSKLGGQNTDGGSVRLSDGYIYTADYNGDLSAIDDNIYLFDRSGNTVAYWETDGGLTGTQCTGGSVDTIIDVAADPVIAGRVYATGVGGNVITEIDLSDTSGGAAASSPCVIMGTYAAPAGISSLIAIEYDPTNDGYWMSDFSSTNLVLVANDGTFATVLETFAFNSGAGYSTGISPQTSGGNPLPLWVTDFTSMNANVLDSGTVPVELQSFNIE
ncbi:MAG: hypothetical protein ABFS37_07270 [Acidobacteriota bacterium]